MSTNPRPKIGVPHFQRITPDTKLHIDFEWWDKSNLDLRTYLFTRLGLSENLPTDVDAQVDLIDPETAEVTRIDGFQYLVQTYFNQLPPDFARRSSLVDAVFCVLLANANRPLAIREVAARVDRSPDVVLRTFRGPQVYQGVRPIKEES